jgi:hypothetical protein
VLLAQGVVGVRAIDDLVQQNKCGFIRQLVFLNCLKRAVACRDGEFDRS